MLTMLLYTALKSHILLKYHTKLDSKSLLLVLSFSLFYLIMRFSSPLDNDDHCSHKQQDSTSSTSKMHTSNSSWRVCNNKERRSSQVNWNSLIFTAFCNVVEFEVHFLYIWRKKICMQQVNLWRTKTTQFN